tara:strand:- start:158 stop:403 length:246 start_codon:yes stop_codon:yes gene_type:complete
MNLDKTMDELERHINHAASYFADVKLEIEDLESNYLTEIDTLGEQNELLEEQVEELSKKLAIFELENMELRLRIEVYAVDL